MDGKTKANGLYTAKNNIIASDEDNAKNFNEGLNDTQGWGEHGTILRLINIGIIEEPSTIRSYDDVQEHSLRHYAEEPRSHGIIKI
jgi:hypothetical protein